MKQPALKKISSSVVSLIPDLCAKGRLLALLPLGRILRGCYLEDSSDENRLYVWAFVQPLYVPASTIVFDLGKRLGGMSATWSVDVPEALATMIEREGLPFCKPINSPEAVADWELLNGRCDAFALEAKAYSLIAAGRVDESLSVVDRLERELTGEIPWIVETRRRAKSLAASAATDLAKAHAQLASWESETRAQLDLMSVA
jgi:hypothetical protein